MKLDITLNGVQVNYVVTKSLRKSIELCDTFPKDNEDAREMKPDYFIVLPYGFINEFIKREKQFLNQGGKFLVLMPEFKIISK